MTMLQSQMKSQAAHSGSLHLVIPQILWDQQRHSPEAVPSPAAQNEKITHGNQVGVTR